MERQTIISNLSKYFAIYELVDRQTYERHKEDAWMFFDTDLLHCLLIVREGINKPIDINNWFWNGQYDERGLRTNLCELVQAKTNKNQLYLSAHMLGKAVDFKVVGMTSEKVREWIILNEKKFPCKIRLEHVDSKTGKPITWVHVDVYSLPMNTKVQLFDV